MINIKDKIEETRRTLDAMIANQENGERILAVSVELDKLIEEYISLNGSGK